MKKGTIIILSIITIFILLFIGLIFNLRREGLSTIRTTAGGVAGPNYYFGDSPDGQWTRSWNQPQYPLVFTKTEGDDPTFGSVEGNYGFPVYYNYDGSAVKENEIPITNEPVQNWYTQEGESFPVLASGWGRKFEPV